MSWKEVWKKYSNFMGISVWKRSIFLNSCIQIEILRIFKPFNQLTMSLWRTLTLNEINRGLFVQQKTQIQPASVFKTAWNIRAVIQCIFQTRTVIQCTFQTRTLIQCILWMILNEGPHLQCSPGFPYKDLHFTDPVFRPPDVPLFPHFLETNEDRR